ncbi:CBS domain-containing protein [Oxalobacter vibrioformis]|uniref:CBS domain-containing protein n=2 Tax=Oxalobacter vibrioformis TaxID=933080 RepID=A0A9E9P3I0_9BURK|nr:CBS domain-containing protein [Oxalobacter vibrioformis]WAW09166.1 CBS domain-containing protein [Oxalobacter vibrioformis]
MKIRDIMTRSVVTVEMDDKLSLVKEIFDNSKFHHLLVIDGGKLFGVVSDRDLLKAISPNLGTMVVTYRDLATLNKRVHQIMTRKPITLKPDNSISDAAALFNTHRISCIPVVNDEFQPVGIVSWRDLVKTMLPKPEL